MGTPGVRLRMLTSESKPVRTPTFTPRLNVQLLWARGLKEKYRVAFNELRGEPTQGLRGPMLPSLVSANRG